MRLPIPCFLALSLLGGCSCTPAVDGVVAIDMLPAAAATVKTYLLRVPVSGDLDLMFTRQDGRDGYAGSVYLFVTRPDCVSLPDDPVSLRDGQRFRPKRLVLANSYADDNCCRGRVTLTSPARVTGGETVKVFVYGLYQPADLPYVLTFQAGDPQCRSSRIAALPEHGWRGRQYSAVESSG
jgi:hypothetical protein